MDSSPTGTEEWKTEWFAFWADIGVLLCSACCGTCLANRTVAAVSGRPCEAECLTSCLTCCCSTCYGVSLRTKLRAKFNIKVSSPFFSLFSSCRLPLRFVFCGVSSRYLVLQGTRQMDFFLVWCCGSCTGCQHAREVQARDSKYIIPMSSSGGGGDAAPAGEAMSD